MENQKGSVGVAVCLVDRELLRTLLPISARLLGHLLRGRLHHRGPHAEPSVGVNGRIRGLGGDPRHPLYTPPLLPFLFGLMNQGEIRTGGLGIRPDRGWDADHGQFLRTN